MKRGLKGEQHLGADNEEQAGEDLLQSVHREPVGEPSSDRRGGDAGYRDAEQCREVDEAEAVDGESGRLKIVDRVPYGAGEGDREPDGCTSLSILAARDRSIRENGIDLAIVRRHGEQVYAGPADAIDRLLADPAIENPDLVRLAVGTPSHSSYLSSAASAFQTALTESSLASPAVPVLAGISGRRIRTRDQAIDALSRQIRCTLRWDNCMSALVEGGIETVIELGPGNDLAKIIEQDHPGISARSVDEFCDWRALSGWLTSRCR